MSDQRFEGQARVRYIGSTNNLRGHTGRIAYYYWNDQWIVTWDDPRPTDRYGRGMWRSRPIAGKNLALIPVGNTSHALWAS